MLRCGPKPVWLVLVGRTSHRRVLRCTPLTWLRVVLFAARHGFEPADEDHAGISPERAEAFSQALERGLVFVPACDAETQAQAWHQMNDVPMDTRLTTAQMALRECCLTLDRETYVLGWSGPKTWAILERLQRRIRAEGGVQVERVK